MKPDYSHVAPPPDSAVTLEKIRRMLKAMLVIQVAASVSTVLMGLIALAEVVYYYPKMSESLSPTRLATTIDNAMAIVAASKNITSDVAFFADGARYSFAAFAPARRALLAQDGISPALQEAAAGTLNALTTKIAGTDGNAPFEFLRYLMAVDWADSVAPRIDRGLASVRGAESLAAVVLGALTAANATALALINR